MNKQLSQVLALLPGLDRNELLVVISTAQSLTLRGRNQAVVGNRQQRQPQKQQQQRNAEEEASPQNNSEEKKASNPSKKGNKKAKSDLARQQSAKHSENVQSRTYIEYKSADKALRSVMRKASTEEVKVDFKSASNNWVEPSTPLTNEADYISLLDSRLPVQDGNELRSTVRHYLLCRWRWFREKGAEVGQDQPSGSPGDQPVAKRQGDQGDGQVSIVQDTSLGVSIPSESKLQAEEKEP
jgi:hypothetical protein